MLHTNNTTMWECSVLHVVVLAGIGPNSNANNAKSKFRATFYRKNKYLNNAKISMQKIFFALLQLSVIAKK